MRRKDRSRGLFHLAFELENEVDLVDGYNRARAAGVSFSHTRDHDVAHSLYLRDPDGNMVEIYADVIREWWTNRHGTIIKKKPDYIPGISSPTSERNYPVNPEIKVVPEAIFHSQRVTHVASGDEGFRADVRLLHRRHRAAGPGWRSARNACGLARDGGGGWRYLLRQRAGLEPELHHVGLEVADEANLDQALPKLAARGIAVEGNIDHPARRAITIRNSSGIRLQFFVNRAWQPKVIATVSADDAPYVL